MRRLKKKEKEAADRERGKGERESKWCCDFALGFSTDQPGKEGEGGGNPTIDFV